MDSLMLAVQPPGSALPALGMGWLAFVGLLALRIAATFLMTPVFHAAPLPASARILLVLALSAVVATGAADGQAITWTGWPNFIGAATTELALGATMGLGILLAFAAFSMAGQVLDVQLGFGMAQIIDPVTQRPVPMLTSAFEHVGILVFFLVNGHHALMRGIGYGIERFPVGAPWSLANAAGPVIKQAAGLLGLGFALAAPVVFCILLVEFALSVVARNLPQMNMFVIGIPVKIVLGLVALSLWFGGIGGAMTRVYATIATTWDSIFSAAEPVR